MPPRSFVSSVYCASPSPSRPRSFESRLCSRSACLGPSTCSCAHVGDVEDAPVAADGDVLRDHALVLDGHLPAGERHHSRPERDVAIVQRSAPESSRRPQRATLQVSAFRPAREARRSGVTAREPAVRCVSRPSGSSGSRCRSPRRSARSNRRSGAAAHGGHRRLDAPPPPRPAAEARRDHRDPHRLAERLVDDRAEDHVRVRVGMAGDDLGRLVDLEQPEAGAARDVEETPVAPSSVVSSSGDETAAFAASAARLSPEAVPIPIRAEPASRMIVRTSAKSRLTSPGTVIRSVMPWTPWRRMSSAIPNASVTGSSSRRPAGAGRSRSRSACRPGRAGSGSRPRPARRGAVPRSRTAA